MGNTYDRHFGNPEGTPETFAKPSFEPTLGLPGRERRVMVATEEQMYSARLEPSKRDYCAHKLMDFQACRHVNFPWVVACSHEKHAYLTCEYEDYVLRMKEFEREKRLLRKRQRQEA